MAQEEFSRTAKPSALTEAQRAALSFASLASALFCAAACASGSPPPKQVTSPDHPLRLRLTNGELELDGARVATLDAESHDQTLLHPLASALKNRKNGRADAERSYAFEVPDRATNAQVWRVLRTLADAGWPTVEIVRAQVAQKLRVPSGTAAARLPAVDRGVYVALGSGHTELVWLEDDLATSGPLTVLERHLLKGSVDDALKSGCDSFEPACSKVTVDADPLSSFDATFALLGALERAEPRADPPLVSFFLDGPVPERPRPERYQVAHPRLVRLPATDIQGVLRAAFPRFEKCYVDGLARNPRLRGTVTLDFYIRRDGHAVLLRPALFGADSQLTSSRGLPPERTRFEPMEATDAPDELPDELVKACAHWVVTTLAFPRPRGGSVYVTYPLPFRPE